MTLQIFSPVWFYGYDALFELISIISVLFIGLFSIKAYKFTKNKNYINLTFAFLLIGFAFVIKIFTNLLAYFGPMQYMKQIKFGSYLITLYSIDRYSFVFDIGYFFYRIAILFGMLLILLLALKIKDWRQVSLFSFFLVISTLFSTQEYFIFHITAAFMLFFVMHFFYKNWKKRRTESSLTLALSFFMIFLSQVVFIFVVLNKGVYVIGEIFQLVGYIILLYTYWLVLSKPKAVLKTFKDR